MTLIELLVSIIVIGSIVAVLAATVTVTFRQNADTQGRLDIARWGQSLAIWLPTDIASASDVKDVPVLAPPMCPSADCNFGSNALWLSWNDGSGLTTVSYRYGPAAGGASFILTRVECKAGVCRSLVVLRDLSGPVDAGGNPVPWYPGNAVPDSVINVTLPLEVDATAPGGPTVTTIPGSMGAQRVIVNVNGVPGIDGADRSSSVSFTAGGSSFDTLDPTTYEPPQFLNANSGCGGPVTLIVDESASLSDANMVDIKLGVRSFVKALEGTPTQLQIITFHTTSATLQEASPGGKWNRFFDLSNPTEVSKLIGPTGTTGLVSNLAIGTGTGQGGTNWEDALHRAFFKKNGDSYDVLPDVTAPMPELVVFFTDGVPTFDREHAKSDTKTVVTVSSPTVNAKFVHSTANTPSKAYGNDMSPRGWYRAEQIVDRIRNRDPKIRLIGVGVGPAFIVSAPVYRPGWPSHMVSTSTVYDPIPNSAFLGDLVVNQDPSLHGSMSSGGATTRTYSAGTWGNVSDADVLVTDNFSQFGSALTAIALAGCGGTLTVQTRDQNGDPFSADTTYTVGTKQVTTSAIAKAGTFDINLNGISSAEVVLLPPSFDGTGYTPQGWNCRAAGADLVPGAAIPLGESGYRLMPAGTPSEGGVGVTVSATNAVSCTLRVAP